MLSFCSISWGSLRTAQIAAQRPCLLIGKAASHQENHFGAFALEQSNYTVKHPWDHPLNRITIKDNSRTVPFLLKTPLSSCFTLQKAKCLLLIEHSSQHICESVTKHKQLYYIVNICQFYQHWECTELFVYCTQWNTREASESFLFCCINQDETFSNHKGKPINRIIKKVKKTMFPLHYSLSDSVPSWFSSSPAAFAACSSTRLLQTLLQPLFPPPYLHRHAAGVTATATKCNEGNSKEVQTQSFSHLGTRRGCPEELDLPLLEEFQKEQSFPTTAAGPATGSQIK